MIILQNNNRQILIPKKVLKNYLRAKYRSQKIYNRNKLMIKKK